MKRAPNSRTWVLGLLTRSVSMTDETTRSLELQVGARNLLENLVADVNSAHLFLDPPGPTTCSLALIKLVDPDAQARIKLNTRPGFPFVETEVETADLLPALKTTYLFVPERKEVVRKVEKGELALLDEDASRGIFTRYEMRNAQPIYDKPLASSVAVFSLTHVGYDEEGQPVPVEDLPKPCYQKTAFLLVRLRTVFDEGLYASGNRRTPTVDIATKVFSYKRLSDVMYRQYFSSADEDARF
ncbi:MAG: hypothetical protein HY814_04575 [Candidatus Riflebacteria bacterium]|nr:hypothetical protein [Candidatus Riflebacteria bacterium]